jgi:membrane fusion protein (multidrug efflux system)
VFSKSLSADTGSKSFRVEIAVPNQDQTIRANVFAEVWIEIEKLEDVLVLPLPALLLDRYLMVVENGRARKIEVQKGVSNADVFVVSAGLKAGQVVIVEGNYDLQDGQEVTF